MAGATQASDDAEPDEGAAPVASPKKKGKALIIGLLMAVMAAAGGGYFFFARKAPVHAGAADEHGAAGEHGEAGAAAPGGSASYLALDPAFVVNLNDEEAMRFQQVQVEVMSRDAKALEAVKLHTPRIRNSLLMLFGQQRLQDINTREGKQALQEKSRHMCSGRLRASAIGAVLNSFSSP